MTAIQKKRVAQWLIALVLIANNGISANTLYCLCKGNYQISLSAPKDDCSEQKISRCCHKTEKTPCCGISGNHHCDTRSVKYFKIDFKSTTRDVVSLVDNNMIKMLFPIFLIGYFVTSKPYNKPLILSNKPPPLRPYGRQLLKQIQVYRC